MEGHEAVVRCINYAVETYVEDKDDHDNEPAWDEIDEKADFVRGEPAP